jgi:hypothetical protein
MRCPRAHRIAHHQVAELERRGLGESELLPLSARATSITTLPLIEEDHTGPVLALSATVRQLHHRHQRAVPLSSPAGSPALALGRRRIPPLTRTRPPAPLPPHPGTPSEGTEWASPEE